MGKYTDDRKRQWERLLCGARRRKSTANNRFRGEFKKDYDRIISSTSFRRLQDKAQVFPLQQNDFTRTRLTHSLEAQITAQNLGRQVALNLIDRGDIDENQANDIVDLLGAAALIHDLGNPPFGHYGEIVIGKWFEDWFSERKELESELGEKCRDFKKFEGNAQTFRIVTRLQSLNDQYGLNLTFATLATQMKYPVPSIPDNKKFGYFDSEKDIVKEIRENLDIEEGKRHPLTYLLEAADDIAYIFADIEDGVRKGVLNWEKAYKKLKTTYKFRHKFEEEFDGIDKLMEQKEYYRSSTTDVQNFKIKMQNRIVEEVAKIFMDNYDKIMDFEFEESEEFRGSKKAKSGDKFRELISCNEHINALCSELKNMARENCYNCEEVIKLELVGDVVINKLLDIFIEGICDIEGSEDPMKKLVDKSNKIYSLISPTFRYAMYRKDIKKEEIEKGSLECEKLHSKEHSGEQFDSNDTYKKIQLVIDFLSGMTDSYILNLYNTLTGVTLPTKY